jgi:ubiquinone biosynthesis protein UbiJ
MEFRQIMATVLERTLNATLAMDPVSVQLLAKLEGRVIAMNIESIDGSFYLLPHRQGVSIEIDHDQNPDIIIEGGLLAYARSATASVRGLANPDRLLEISGDAELVAVMRDFLRSLQPDLEEQLSSLIGDIPARQAGNQIRSFAEWAEQVGQSIAVNTGEYLTEEKQLLVARPRIDRFLIAVDQLQNDTERLASRLGTLEKVDRKS